MVRREDYKGELRSAFTMRLLENAERDVQTSSTGGVFLRVALGVIYMYLIVLSHQILGIIGPVFISLLFLVAFFIPILFRTLSTLRQKRKELRESQLVAEETE